MSAIYPRPVGSNWHEGPRETDTNVTCGYCCKPEETLHFPFHNRLLLRNDGKTVQQGPKKTVLDNNLELSPINNIRLYLAAHYILTHTSLGYKKGKEVTYVVCDKADTYGNKIVHRHPPVTLRWHPVRSVEGEVVLLHMELSKYDRDFSFARAFQNLISMSPRNRDIAKKKMSQDLRMVGMSDEFVHYCFPWSDVNQFNATIARVFGMKNEPMIFNGRLAKIEEEKKGNKKQKKDEEEEEEEEFNEADMAEVFSEVQTIASYPFWSSHFIGIPHPEYFELLQEEKLPRIRTVETNSLDLQHTEEELGEKDWYEFPDLFSSIVHACKMVLYFDTNDRNMMLRTLGNQDFGTYVSKLESVQEMSRNDNLDIIRGELQFISHITNHEQRRNALVGLVDNVLHNKENLNEYVSTQFFKDKRNEVLVKRHLSKETRFREAVHDKMEFCWYSNNNATNAFLESFLRNSIDCATFSHQSSELFLLLLGLMSSQNMNPLDETVDMLVMALTSIPGLAKTRMLKLFTQSFREISPLLGSSTEKAFSAEHRGAGSITIVEEFSQQLLGSTDANAHFRSLLEDGLARRAAAGKENESASKFSRQEVVSDYRGAWNFTQNNNPGYKRKPERQDFDYMESAIISRILFRSLPQWKGAIPRGIDESNKQFLLQQETENLHLMVNFINDINSLKFSGCFDTWSGNEICRFSFGTGILDDICFSAKNGDFPNAFFICKPHNRSENRLRFCTETLLMMRKFMELSIDTDEKQEYLQYFELNELQDQVRELIDNIILDDVEDQALARFGELGFTFPDTNDLILKSCQFLLKNPGNKMVEKYLEGMRQFKNLFSKFKSAWILADELNALYREAIYNNEIDNLDAELDSEEREEKIAEAQKRRDTPDFDENIEYERVIKSNDSLDQLIPFFLNVGYLRKLQDPLDFNIIERKPREGEDHVVNLCFNDALTCEPEMISNMILENRGECEKRLREKAQKLYHHGLGFNYVSWYLYIQVGLVGNSFESKSNEKFLEVQVIARSNATPPNENRSHLTPEDFYEIRKDLYAKEEDMVRAFACMRTDFYPDGLAQVCLLIYSLSKPRQTQVTHVAQQGGDEEEGVSTTTTTTTTTMAPKTDDNLNFDTLVKTDEYYKISIDLTQVTKNERGLRQDFAAIKALCMRLESVQEKYDLPAIHGCEGLSSTLMKFLLSGEIAYETYLTTPTGKKKRNVMNLVYEKSPNVAYLMVCREMVDYYLQEGRMFTTSKEGKVTFDMNFPLRNFLQQITSKDSLDIIVPQVELDTLKGGNAKWMKIKAKTGKRDKISITKEGSVKRVVALPTEPSAVFFDKQKDFKDEERSKVQDIATQDEDAHYRKEHFRSNNIPFSQL